MSSEIVGHSCRWKPNGIVGLIQQFNRNRQCVALQ